MAKVSTTALLLPFVTGILNLIKPSEDGQDRRNLRRAWRMYKRLKKEWSKDGLDAEEKEMLADVKRSLSKRTIELGN